MPAGARADVVASARAAPVRIAGYDGDVMEPFVTRDGRYLIFNNRNDPPERTDLFYAERSADRTFHFRGPVRGVNSPALDAVASVTSNDEFFFISSRAYDRTRNTVFRGHWHAGSVTRVVAVAGMAARAPGIVTFDIEVSADGRRLYYVDGDFRGGGPPRDAHVRLAQRTPTGFARDPQSDAIFARIDQRGEAYAPALSRDERLLVVTIATPDVGPQLFVATRRSRDWPFDHLTALRAANGFVEGASVADNGRTIYYHQRDGNRFVLMAVQR